MSEAPPQVAPCSPEELSNAMSQLRLPPSTTSLLDLPAHIIFDILDTISVWNIFDTDIASLRLTCRMVNSWVLERATTMELTGPIEQVNELSSLPVRLLQTMPNLQLLDMKQCKRSPLNLVGLPTTITTLNLGGPRSRKWEMYGTGIKDIYPRTEIDLSPLSKCIGLTDLDISSCKRVADLSPLAACKYLGKLSLSRYLDLTSLSLLTSSCTNLRIMNLCQTSITDLIPLSACKELERIDCSYTRVSDLSPLSACLKLRTVNCSQTNVSDISPLSACLGLCWVNFLYTGVEDITSLAACPQLRTIICEWVDELELRIMDGEFMHPDERNYHPAFPEVQFIVPSEDYDVVQGESSADEYEF